MATVNLILPVVLPFRLDLTVWALRRRQKNVIDQWNGYQYTRVVVIENEPVKMTITQRGIANNPELSVVLQSDKPLARKAQKVAERLAQKMLGLNVDLRPFYTLAENDAALKPLVAQFMGVKPPRYPNVFEALINAVACQQISLDAGIAVLVRLSETSGTAYVDGNKTAYAFPSPEDLLNVSESELRKIGFSYQKIQTIKTLAYGAASGEIDLASLKLVTNEEALAYLQKIHGIGRWSAEYVLIRGLGRLDVFPGDDVGAQNNLQQLLFLEERPDYTDIKQLTKTWDPYAGLIYFHLLLQKLTTKGVI